MLGYAATAIRDIHEIVGVKATEPLRHKTNRLHTMAKLMEEHDTPDEGVKMAMLEAADMLRTLKILLDATEELLEQ